MLTWIGWVIALAASAGAVLAFKALSRRAYVAEREPLSLAEIYALVKDQVSWEIFNEVWLKIGEAFSLDPRLISPTDTLRSLFNVDSWDLGEGEEALGRWLERQRLGTPPSLETVLDLAKWMEASRAARVD